jgi:hypothetical protein
MDPRVLKPEFPKYCKQNLGHALEYTHGYKILVIDMIATKRFD